MALMCTCQKCPKPRESIILVGLELPVPKSESDNLKFSMALDLEAVWLGIKMENDFWVDIYSGEKLRFENWSKGSKTKSKLTYGYLQPDSNWKTSTGNDKIATMCVTNPNNQPITMKPPPKPTKAPSTNGQETSGENSNTDSPLIEGTNFTIAEVENIFQNFNFNTGWFQT